MKKIIFSLLLIIPSFFSESINAQEYKTAIGLRFAWDYGITFKHFIKENTAIEIIGSTRSFGIAGFSNYRYTRITGLYQIHKPIESVEGLKWYYGGGLTAAFYSGDYFDTIKDSKTALGLSGVLGLDYKFKDTPINVSLDWMPTFFITGFGNGFGGQAGGLAVRYTF